MCPLGALLWALSRKGSGFSGKNDLEACLQGIFSNKAWRRKAPKPAKVFIYVYVRKLSKQQYYAEDDNYRHDVAYGNQSVRAATG